MDLEALGGSEVVGVSSADVGVSGERARRGRLSRMLVILGGLVLWLWWRILSDNPIRPPRLTSTMVQFIPIAALIIMLGAALMVPILAASRSPHVLFRSDEIDISLDDVKGMPIVVDEVVRSLNLFLGYKTFQEKLGGNPRRAVLFEGPPGTGKTYVAKAMAREAGVPFLFVSSSAFQSMFYGQTNKKIRSYFKALRKAARHEGGAIGFIEEIDAIAASRSGTGPNQHVEGVAGVVNELLVQLQSFESPTNSTRLRGWLVDQVNRVLPHGARLSRPVVAPANFLVIGATNRAADLDPALMRPGRFDRSIYFDLPGRRGRREILDHYLAKKTHDAELDDPARRDTLAAMTSGYTPVMLERMLDEALVWGLRRGAAGLNWEDVQRAKMTSEIGLAHPVEYTEAERRTIATHEAGHATVAWLVGVGRRLEVLSIIKRKEALGLLAHSETEERWLASRSELRGLIQIALAGMLAEELAFGEITSGAASDLRAATTLAAQMIGSLGMDGTLFSWEAAATAQGNIVTKLASTDDGRDRIEAMLSELRDDTRILLEHNRHITEALRDALLERDELLGDEIARTILGASDIELRDPIASPQPFCP